ncbi:MAG: type I methionyl aminopeptidase [Clostridiales bacterium]|jgi:methionyl aminopeptidase|nr:type I methionyl aminopeptidase [Clostridiales bacterium]
MIIIKSQEALSKMRASARILKDTFRLLEENVKAGITTEELDRLAYEYITRSGGRPSFLNYNGYPASICASVDEEVVHGIPSKRRLEGGQIVGIDIGVFFEGFHTDAARTFAVGKISPEKQKLIDVTRQCFFEGLAAVKEGARLGDVGYRIQRYAENNGFSVVRDLVGHGIGVSMHEDPNVPNFGTLGHGIRLKEGMTLAIEPMINAGSYHVKWLGDGWTVVTCDGKPSAHYENTVVVTKEGAEILTLRREEKADG